MSISSGERAEMSGDYACAQCGEEIHVNRGESVPLCPHCGNGTYQSEFDEVDERPIM